MRMPRHLLLLLALIGLVPHGAASASADDATALVKRTTERMLATLEARRAEVDRDPSLIFGMIESGVAPHFDFERITQGAVGQSWRAATPAQQRALVDGFKQVLIRTYARSILSYSGEEIRYLPVKPGSRPSTVTVSTEIYAPGSAPIPVDYRMHNSSGAWKVYDVVINNASLVGNYRTSFTNEIRQSGLDGLIAKLGDMNARGHE
ncbi:MAG: ABC transporter substrate-binding protein [Thiocapsa sp.]|jgi:phospholipid transport system substrate-binding protein|nr:ABC transporter substrate-binding protein [Thiocapsa sp.]MCG6896206.1 ABC transporter substrate-binding protein [Thiocapsa sp.]MCG6983670.1 ABC transporter substrate-binding protein [Thiocapsa sp.]